jgi:hypothetical protein
VDRGYELFGTPDCKLPLPPLASELRFGRVPNCLTYTEIMDVVAAHRKETGYTAWDEPWRGAGAGAVISASCSPVVPPAPAPVPVVAKDEDDMEIDEEDEEDKEEETLLRDALLRFSNHLCQCPGSPESKEEDEKEDATCQDALRALLEVKACYDVNPDPIRILSTEHRTVEDEDDDESDEEESDEDEEWKPEEDEEESEGSSEDEEEDEDEEDTHKNDENILENYRAALRALMKNRADMEALRVQIAAAAAGDWHTSVPTVLALLVQVNQYRLLMEEDVRLNTAFLAAFHKIHEGIL